MNETRRKPTTGRQSPSLSNKWHRIFYMPSRIDTAGHTKAFDYPVTEHWGKAEMFSYAGGTRTDNTSGRSRTRYQLSHPLFSVQGHKVIVPVRTLRERRYTQKRTPTMTARPTAPQTVPAIIFLDCSDLSVAGCMMTLGSGRKLIHLNNERIV